MSAPDRIWIDGAVNANVWAEQKTDCTLSGVAAYEYRRADLCDPTQDERVKALEAENARLKHALVVWDAAHRTGRNEPLVVAFETGVAALRALEQG